MAMAFNPLTERATLITRVRVRQMRSGRERVCCAAHSRCIREADCRMSGAWRVSLLQVATLTMVDMCGNEAIRDPTGDRMADTSKLTQVIRV